MERLLSFIQSKGYDFEPILDGQFREFADDNQKGWYVGTKELLNDKELTTLTFGDWRTGDKYHFRENGGGELTDDLRALSEERIKIQEEKFKLEKARKNEETKLLAQSMWSEIPPEGQGASPYLAKKKIGKLFGARTRRPPGGSVELVIPMMDEEKVLWGLQKIQADGFKSFLPGQRVKGLFFQLGKIKSKIYLAEGFATAATIHVATEDSVFVCFNASNLVEVANIVRHKCPNLPIIIAGDDDRFKKVNVGREKAQEAALLVRGSTIFPNFKDLSTKPTDWNDLLCLEGLESVKAQLSSHVPIPPDSQIHDTPPTSDLMPQDPTPKSKSSLKLESMVVKALLDELQGDIIKQDKDVFIYKEGYWRLCSERQLDWIKLKLQKELGARAKNKDVVSAFNLFLTNIPHASRNLFIPDPYTCNFKNGTLHLVQDKDFNHTLEFKPHNREDFCTSQIPINFEQKTIKTNQKFEEMIQNLFKNDEDMPEKVKALKQMFGACLMPAFPHLFMLYGPPATGKSTVIMLVSKFLDEKNISRVEPHMFKDFYMESMVGKLANIVTDIDITAPIKDANVKKIEDRVPMLVNRKGIKAIYAPLPAVHIFGGNSIPPTLEGAIKAHDRRWTFLEFKSFQPSGPLNRNFASWVYNQGPEAILGFALEGLRDLCASGGRFMNPASGIKKMEEWQIENDPVEMFLQDVRENEISCNLGSDTESKIVPLEIGLGHEMPRSVLFKVFDEWYCNTVSRQRKISRRAFFEMLRRKNFAEHKRVGVRYFKGIGPGVKGSGLY